MWNPSGSVQTAAIGIALATVMSGTGFGQGPAVQSVERQGVSVAYVSEVPFQWKGELGNPLELWARKLSSEWAPARDGNNERLKNLRPQLSWDKLEKSARSHKTDIFVIHAYEFIQYGKGAQLDALLVPSREGMAAMTEFVVLRQRPPDTGPNWKFRMVDFDKQEIVLVDRGGCGDLVYRWLDKEIRADTGYDKRDNLAEFHTASSAEEAILAVYFGEAHACVVSRAAYRDVVHYNAKGLTSRLTEVLSSPPLLQHVIACPHSMAAARQRELQQNAAKIRLLQLDKVWTLTAPKPEDFKNLKELIDYWQLHCEEKSGGADTEAPSPPALPPAAASARVERRPG